MEDPFVGECFPFSLREDVLKSCLKLWSDYSELPCSFDDKKNGHRKLMGTLRLAECRWRGIGVDMDRDHAAISMKPVLVELRRRCASVTSKLQSGFLRSGGGSHALTTFFQEYDTLEKIATGMMSSATPELRAQYITNCDFLTHPSLDSDEDDEDCTLDAKLLQERQHNTKNYTEQEKVLRRRRMMLPRSYRSSRRLQYSAERYAFELGRCYDHGFGLPKPNLDRAMELYACAAAARHFRAAVNLGFLLCKKAVEPGPFDANLYFSPVCEFANEAAKRREGERLAFRLFSWAAQTGDPVAKLEACLCILKGEGCEKDEKLALKLCHDMANARHPGSEVQHGYYGVPFSYGVAFAYLELGRCCLSGEGMPVDPEKGGQMILTSLKHDPGNKETIICYADCLSTGIGLPQDTAKAHELLVAQADKHSPVAMMRLVGLLEHKTQLKPSLQMDKQILVLLDKLSKEGEHFASMAESKRCDFLLTGRGGMIKDEAKAIDIFERLALKGESQALQRLVDLFSRGVGRMADETELMGILQGAAENGSSFAMVQLANMLRMGQGAPRDPERAVRLLRDAADRDDQLGQLYLAQCYYTGDGVPMDQKHGVQLLSDLSEKGNDVALGFLASYYIEALDKSIFSDIDFVALLTPSCQRGNAHHQQQLARLYMDGLGVEADEKKGFELFQQAAQGAYVHDNDVYPTILLAECYLIGQGCEKDPLHGARLLRDCCLEDRSGHAAYLLMKAMRGSIMTRVDRLRVMWEIADGNREQLARVLCQSAEESKRHSAMFHVGTSLSMFLYSNVFGSVLDIMKDASPTFRFFVERLFFKDLLAEKGALETLMEHSRVADLNALHAKVVEIKARDGHKPDAQFMQPHTSRLQVPDGAVHAALSDMALFPPSINAMIVDYACPLFRQGMYLAVDPFPAKFPLTSLDPNWHAARAAVPTTSAKVDYIDQDRKFLTYQLSLPATEDVCSAPGCDAPALNSSDGKQRYYRSCPACNVPRYCSWSCSVVDMVHGGHAFRCSNKHELSEVQVDTLVRTVPLTERPRKNVFSELFGVNNERGREACFVRDVHLHGQRLYARVVNSYANALVLVEYLPHPSYDLDNALLRTRAQYMPRPRLEWIPISSKRLTRIS